ncbi:MAG: squalene--hopene cyclase [Armatimonadota bacterium]
MNTKIQRLLDYHFPPSAAVTSAVDKAVSYLIGIQHPDGYWVGELEGDTILESEYIILMRFLGHGDEAKLGKAAAYIRQKQMECGGWSLFPGGPVDVSSSVKAYFSLKLTGSTGDEPYMIRAREAIEKAGGVWATNSYTRFYLAMLGQIPWNDAPAVPAELMLLPDWFYFNIYEISSWSRTFVVPLTIIWARKLTVQLDHLRGIRELIEPRQRNRKQHKGGLFTWKHFFYTVDSAIKLAEKIGFLPWREKGVRRAEQWMLDHLDHSAGLGAIYPPIVYSLISMRALGYEDSHPEVERAMEELHRLEIEEQDTLRLQPCTSPVWDSAIAVNALVEAGVDPDHPVIKRAAEWILSKEVKLKGDWQVKRPNLEPGGWYFEFANENYPDIDDTAMVLMALRKVGSIEGKDDAIRRGIAWLLGMQAKDGGWASFDVDNNKRVFNQIPFADHNAMLDPSTSDITARIIEMLSFFGFDKNSSAVRKAIDFLRREQEPDGSWYGRWGVNYIYGTWQAIRGLTRVGIDIHDPMIDRAADWLESVQHDDGGWGETCCSYYDPSYKNQGESTASQTAWALMGLICAGRADSEPALRGVDYLIRTQNEQGAWDEEPYTGAGFPRVFFLRYHLYRHTFPLMALGMYKTAK